MCGRTKDYSRVFTPPGNRKVLENDQLYSPTSVVVHVDIQGNRKREKRNEFAAQQHKKTITYNNIYKIH